MLTPSNIFFADHSDSDITEGTVHNKHHTKRTDITAQAADDKTIIANRSIRAVETRKLLYRFRIHELTEREEHERPTALEPRLCPKLDVLPCHIEATAPPGLLPFLQSALQLLVEVRELVRMQRTKLVK